MNKEVGKELRIIRMTNKLSLRALGIKTGIPYSRLGKFERGEELPTNEIISKIELALNIDFSELIKCSNEMNQLFDSFIDSLFYHDDNNDLFKVKTEKIQKNYMISNECGKILLIQYIVFVLENDLIKARSIEKELFEYFDFNDECKAILYQYKGISYRIEKQNEKAILWLEEALSIASNDKDKAMISYHLCVPYMDSRRMPESMKCLKFAESIFSEHGSFKRLTYCHLEYALLFEVNRDYRLSMKYFNQVLKETEIINFSNDFRSLVYLDMCGAMISSENYLEALEYLEEANSLNANQPSAILYGIWCNYKLGNYVEAEKLINDNKSLKDNSLVKKNYQLFAYLIKEKDNVPTKKLINYTVNLIKSMSEYEATERIIFYIDILLDLLEQRNNKEEKNKYLEMKINLLKYGNLCQCDKSDF